MDCEVGFFNVIDLGIDPMVGKLSLLILVLS